LGEVLVEKCDWRLEVVWWRRWEGGWDFGSNEGLDQSIERAKQRNQRQESRQKRCEVGSWRRDQRGEDQDEVVEEEEEEEEEAIGPWFKMGSSGQIRVLEWSDAGHC
jgi:hypothetical protein